MTCRRRRRPLSSSASPTSRAVDQGLFQGLVCMIGTVPLSQPAEELGSSGLQRARRLRRRVILALLIGPAILLVAAFVLLPTVIAAFDSFRNEGQLTLGNYLAL